MQRISCRDRSTDLVALYGEVDGSYMDGMLPVMIGGKDDTIGSGGVDLERSGTYVTVTAQHAAPSVRKQSVKHSRWRWMAPTWMKCCF